MNLNGKRFFRKIKNDIDMKLLTKQNNLSIIKIENEKPQMWLTHLYVIKTHQTAKFYRCVFLLLFKTIANAIISKIAIIVTPTNPKKSRCITINNVYSYFLYKNIKQK